MDQAPVQLLIEKNDEVSPFILFVLNSTNIDRAPAPAWATYCARCGDTVGTKQMGLHIYREREKCLTATWQEHSGEIPMTLEVQRPCGSNS